MRLCLSRQVTTPEEEWLECGSNSGHLENNLSMHDIKVNTGVPGKIVEVSVEDVQNAARSAAPKMILIMEKMIEKLP